MALPQVLDAMDDAKTDVDGVAHNTSVEESFSVFNYSFENSPQLDKEKLLRYSASSKDEFWDALSHNYDYLMDDGLIATCKEASSDLSLDDESDISESCHWSFTQFIEHFKWLHDLLHNLQVAKESEQSEKKFDTKMLEDQRKIAYLCRLFNDQAQSLSKRYPNMRDEVHRHLNRLNNKWQAVEQSINPNKLKSPSKDCIFEEITNYMRSIRKWLRELEQRLIPVNLTVSWTLEEIENRYKEQEEFHKEIEAKGKYITSLLKLCDRLKGNVRFGQNSLMVWDADRVRKVACNLERQWHSLLLKSVECQCMLDNLMQVQKESSKKLEKSFTEEPVKKHPRLSGYCEDFANELCSMNCSLEEMLQDESLLCCSPAIQKEITHLKDELIRTNDKGVMVGDTGIAELKAGCQNGNQKFEIIQDVGYSSETSAHLSNDEKLDSPETDCYKNLENKSSPSSGISSRSPESCCPKFHLAPDKYPSISLKTLHILSEEKLDFNSKFTNSTGVPNTFYQVTSVDEDVFEDVPDISSSNVPLDSSTHLDANQIFKSKVTNISNSISNLNIDSDSKTNSPKEINKIDSCIKISTPEVSKRTRKGFRPSSNCPKSLSKNELVKKTARVREWLNTCRTGDVTTSDDNAGSKDKPKKNEWSEKALDSSCDASGEYTTESDSEKSNLSDVNNSVAFSQSFTGSIETVIPAVPEEHAQVHSDKAGSTDPSPSGVRLRKKKKVRDRPWSVTDVSQITFSSPVVPHSTSESALDMLKLSQDLGKMRSKKSSPENKKRLSLTDVSTLTGPSIQSLKKNLDALRKYAACSHAENSNCKGENLNSTPKKGLDQCDSFLNMDKLRVDLSKHISSAIEAIRQKALVTDNSSSLEVSQVSENEKSENLNSLEDQGSISWDEYQDPPYLSEPYSEQTADEDEVRKLINFGDDYRAILGSYSDASSVSLKANQPKSHRTRSRSLQKGQGRRNTLVSDSNSDSEDFHNILKTSSRALHFVSTSLKDDTHLSSLSSEFAELVATCQTNLCHLNAIHSELAYGCELESLSKEDLAKLQDLIKEWEVVQLKLAALGGEVEQKQCSVDLQAATQDVRCTLTSFEERLAAMAKNVAEAAEVTNSLSELKNRIQKLQDGMTNLQGMKESLLSVIAKILRLIADGGPSVTPLKEIADKLYHQWEDIYEMNCAELSKLQDIQCRWKEPTEIEVEDDMETSVQWQPVQVGSSLPVPEVIPGEPHPITAAEVVTADQHNLLVELEGEDVTTSIRCKFVEEEPDFKESLQLLGPPAVSTEIPKLPTHPVEANSVTRCSCFWRTLRAAVPIQCAMVLLYIMSCLMEPQCCENMNNFEFSPFPHLRYTQGPPPV